MGADGKNDETRWRDMMARAQSGDREAYNLLLAEIGNAVEAYLRSRFGSGSWIEDCVQESLLSVHRARHTYDPRRPFRPWLFALVRHKAIDLLRSRSYAIGREIPGESAERESCAPDDYAAADHTLDAATLLNRLPSSDREALVLTKIEGLSVEEAAARLGVSRSAIKSRVSRGIKKIQRRLRAEIE